MRYKKKSLEIEAIQFTRNNLEEVKEFTNGKCTGVTEKRPNGSCYCVINTLEGAMRANEGDYIIKGVAGEYYPCKPEIFNRTYSLVEGIKPSACPHCFNARVAPPSDDPFETELTDRNDLSYHILASNSNSKVDTEKVCITLASGGGRRVRIMGSVWDDKYTRWNDYVEYCPKYCPECGRKLDEYKRE